MLNIILYQLYQVDSLDQVQIILNVCTCESPRRISCTLMPRCSGSEKGSRRCCIQYPTSSTTTFSGGTSFFILHSTVELLQSRVVAPVAATGVSRIPVSIKNPRVDPLIIIIQIKRSSNSGRIIHVEIVSPDRDKLCQFQQC